MELEKGSQKADWSKRPLTPKMDAYARNDTRHLKKLADILKDQLKDKGRLEWARESCARLITECATPAPPQPDVVWRVKGSHKLGRSGLAVLRELWHWREQEAIAANKPPYFVLSHETLVDIASAVAEQRAIGTLLPRHFSARRGEGLQKAIEKALAVSPEDLPQFRRPNVHRQTEAERRRFLDLEKRRNARAEELGIDPTLIASRATLLGLAHDWNEGQLELMRWQSGLLERA